MKVSMRLTWIADVIKEGNRNDEKYVFIGHNATHLLK